ncbi:MAG: hypothetical protein R3A44_36230 [Caldilineaceae bacterium]
MPARNWLGATLIAKSDFATALTPAAPTGLNGWCTSPITVSTSDDPAASGVAG